MTISLRQLVGAFLDSADQSSHEFRRLVRIGERLCRTIGMDLTGQIRTVVLDVQPNKTAYLPDDYINYTKIGVLNSIGEVVTYKRNSQLSSWNDIYTQQSGERLEGAPVINTLTPYYDPLVYPNYFYNYFYMGQMYNLFGADSGTAVVGTYKVDESNKIIILNPDNKYSQVVLEYISDGFDPTADDYQIDVRVEEAFICGLRWRNAQDLRKKFSSSDVRQMKIEFYRELRLASMRMNPAILNEMTRAEHASRKLSAKA